MSGRVFLAGAIGLLAASAVAVAEVPPQWRALQPGLLVEVEGKMKNGRFVAKEIDIRPRAASGEFEILAPVEAVDDARVTVLGSSIRLDDGVRIRDGLDAPVGREALGPGVWLEIDGFQDPGELRASRLRVLSEPAKDLQIEGAITAADVDHRSLHVAGLPVRLDRDLRVRGAEVPPPVRREVFVPLVVDDDEVAPASFHGWNGRLRLGGRVEVEYTPEDNFDLNPLRRGDFTFTSWVVEMQGAAYLAPQIAVFGKAGYVARRVITDDEGTENGFSRTSLQQLFALWRPPPFPWLAVQVGRQDFDERREWLYDENLDALRLHVQTWRFRNELSVSKRWDTRASLLRDWTNWMALTELSTGRRRYGSAYVIYRSRDGDGTTRPLWYGVRSAGRLTSGVDHWIDAALLRGTFDGHDLSAWAYDVGLRWRLERRYRFSVTGAYAVGSGGPNEGDRFRQTGFQDNNDKFGGVSSFRYYGELLEPELSNLEIATVGAGLRPWPRSSIDVVFHRYRQRIPERRIHGANLEARTRSASIEVGREIDLIVAFEQLPGIDLEYVFAVFRPGDAFDPIATGAQLHTLQMQFKF